MNRHEQLMSIFQKHLFTENDLKKNVSIRLRPFALDEFWFTAFPKNCDGFVSPKK